MITASSTPAPRTQLATAWPIVVFDIAGPLAAYYGLRAAGLSTVAALILSGALPTIGIARNVARHHELDAIGALVLFGIVVGTVVGLVTGSAHLVLLDGSVPTFVFGVVCLGSLWSTYPLIYRFALEAMGGDTPKGQEFASLWQYEGFRHAFRVSTVVWGCAFLVEAGAQVAIIETASAGVAKTTSTVMPIVVAAGVAGWNVAYGKASKRRGERAAQAAEAAHAAQAAVADGSQGAVQRD